MTLYIPDDIVLLCTGLIVFFVVIYHLNKREDERILQEEITRLAAMSADEREAERMAKKSNDDFMRGVGKYPNL